MKRAIVIAALGFITLVGCVPKTGYGPLDFDPTPPNPPTQPPAKTGYGPVPVDLTPPSTSGPLKTGSGPLPFP